MAPPGGNKDLVRVVPFGTKPASPSDFAHLKDPSSRSFAYDLSKSLPDPRKSKPKKETKKSSDDENENEKEKESLKGEGMPQPKVSNSKFSSDELAKFLESEGGGDPADMCNLPRCMDVVGQIISSDKGLKIEKDILLQEIEAMVALVKDSEKEEEKLQLLADGRNKEQSMLENQVEKQTQRAREIEEKREDLEREKRGFATKQALLEKDQRLWLTKLRTAQAAHAKAIWRKPGQSYEDDEVSIFDGSVQSIKSTTKHDEIEIQGPTQLDYDKLAHTTGVTDYNERAINRPTFSNYVQDYIDVETCNNYKGLSGSFVDKKSYGTVPKNMSKSLAHMKKLDSSEQIKSFDEQLTSPIPKHDAAGRKLDEDSYTVMTCSEMSFRKGALSMPTSVKSYLATGASKNLKRAHALGNDRMATSSRGGYMPDLLRADTSKRSNSRKKLVPLASSSRSVLGGRSVTAALASMGERHGRSSESESLRSIQYDDASINSMSTLGLNSVTDFGDVEEEKKHYEIRIVQPKVLPLPKHTGKLRVNKSGLGTINKKSKTIKELLDAEEALE